MKLVDDAVMASSSGAGNVVDARTDELTGRLASTKTQGVSLTANLSDLEEAHNKEGQGHENLLKKVLAKAKTTKEQVLAEQTVLFFNIIQHCDQLEETSARAMSAMIVLLIR